MSFLGAHHHSCCSNCPLGGQWEPLQASLWDLSCPCRLRQPSGFHPEGRAPSPHVPSCSDLERTFPPRGPDQCPGSPAGPPTARPRCSCLAASWPSARLQSRPFQGSGTTSRLAGAPWGERVDMKPHFASRLTVSSGSVPLPALSAVSPRVTSLFSLCLNAPVRAVSGNPAQEPGRPAAASQWLCLLFVSVPSVAILPSVSSSVT